MPRRVTTGVERRSPPLRAALPRARAHRRPRFAQCLRSDQPPPVCSPGAAHQRS